MLVQSHTLKTPLYGSISSFEAFRKTAAVFGLEGEAIPHPPPVAGGADGAARDLPGIGLRLHSDEGRPSNFLSHKRRYFLDLQARPTSTPTGVRVNLSDFTLRRGMNGLKAQVRSMKKKNFELTQHIVSLKASMEHIDRELGHLHSLWSTYSKPAKRAAPTGTPPVGHYVQPALWTSPTLEKLRSGRIFPEDLVKPSTADLMSSGQSANVAGCHTDLGPGLMPLETMLLPYQNVVSYANYRLDIRSRDLTPGKGGFLARLRKNLAEFHLTLEEFNWQQLIRLLTFSSTVIDGLCIFQSSEVVGVVLLNYLLQGNAQHFYQSLSSPGDRNTDACR